MAVIGNSSTQQAFTPAIDYFSGTGSATAFTLSRPVASVAQVQVTIDNVAQNPSSAYTVSSNTITFTSAPLSGTNNIYVYYTSPITQVIAPGQGTVNTTALGNITNIASGNSSLTLQTGSSNTTAVTVDSSQIATFASNVVSNGVVQALTTVQSSSGADLSLNANGANRDVIVKVNGTEQARFVGSTGNVGMGTASPSSKARLTVSGTTGSGTGGGILITGSGYQTSPTGMVLGQYDATTFYIQRPASSSFEIWDSGSSASLRVDSGGNLQVGAAGRSFSERLTVQSSTATSASDVIIGRDSSATTLFRVRGDGAFQTGSGAVSPYNNTTGNAANTFVNTDGTLLRSTSSLKYKKYVADATHGLTDLLKLRSVTYKGKNEADGEKTFGGLIAEEVHDAGLTEFVHYSTDGSPDALNYGNMVSLCVKAIQELKAINDTQAETINALTARIEALENR